MILETHRKKHMAFLMADLGVLVDKESGKQMSRDVSKILDVIIITIHVKVCSIYWTTFPVSSTREQNYHIECLDFQRFPDVQFNRL